MEEQTKKNSFGKWHDKYYKHLLLIPLVILLFSFFQIYTFQQDTGEFFLKDISLTGGTSATIQTSIATTEIREALQDKLPDLNTRTVSDLITGEQKAVIIETTLDAEETRGILEEYFGFELTSENSSFEFTGSSLSESFFQQLMIAILIAFVFMAFVVFLIFRKFVPSVAVIMAAFTDIVMTLAVINILEIKVSSAGIVAFLMLIGYSVDTDILLTTRILKRHKGSLNERIFSAFKTGTTMTLTSLIAVLIALVLAGSFSVVLSQIFLILSIGLAFDLLNTWITNVSILKWDVKSKNKEGPQ